MKIKSLLLLFLGFFASNALGKQAPWVGHTFTGEVCNGGGQGFGPYDYNTRASELGNLRIVEDNHFTPEVEGLIKGHSTSSPEGDINYTLRAWPNHHRALLSIINLQLKINSKLLAGQLQTPPECYLQRAIHFSPDDAVTYSLFGYYLYKIGEYDKAEKNYLKAIELGPNNAKFEYSYSLLLIEMKRYDDAVKYAKMAYKDGKPPAGLKNKLMKLNLWKDEE